MEDCNPAAVEPPTGSKRASLKIRKKPKAGRGQSTPQPPLELTIDIRFWQTRVTVEIRQRANMEIHHLRWRETRVQAHINQNQSTLDPG